MRWWRSVYREVVLPLTCRLPESHHDPDTIKALTRYGVLTAASISIRVTRATTAENEASDQTASRQRPIQEGNSGEDTRNTHQAGGAHEEIDVGRGTQGMV